MPYCTQADITDQLPEAELVRLTDDAGAAAVDPDKVASAIAAADALIDSYCGKRYAVPLSPVPPVVLARSVDIAIFNLYARRRKAPEDVKARHDAALSWLRDVSKGLATLGEGDPDTTPAPTHRPRITQNPRHFTRDEMDGF